MPNRFNIIIALLAVLLAVTGCSGGGGGGGGDDSAAAPEPAPPVAPPPAPPPPATTYRLSGTITASASQAADSDNNDTARAAVSNDDFPSAQSIPNPITLGGYVNEPGSGAAGRSRASGDREDFFRVELFAGQRVTLIVADFQQADADLYLYDASGRIVDFSIDIGELESLIVPATGTYFVNASIFSGATNYTLAIGANGNTPAVAAARYRDIVPWQSVVGYRDKRAYTNGTGPDIMRRLALEQRAGGRGRSRLLELRRHMIAMAARRGQLGSAMHKSDSFDDSGLRDRWETLLTIKHLRRDPAVAYAEPNYILRSMAIPDDEAYPFQWHYPLINLPGAWDTTTGTPDVLVAVVDTGILPGHPDLAGQLTTGYDFVSDIGNAGDGDGIDANPRDPGSSLGGSGAFHGTHVGGTVAALGDNGLGVAGTAYNARLMPVRALGVDGSGTSYDVNQAIRYAAGLDNDSGQLPARAADIINLSLGGRIASEATRNLLDEVRSAGVMVVASAGNEASSLPSYPAAYETVIAVSAVDAQRRLAPYSNIGPHIDIAAPGGNTSQDLNGDGYPDGVLSTGGGVNGGRLSYEYTFLSGTSMAAPHVAGVLALMKSVNPALTPEDIDALLSLGQLTDDLGPPGRDDQYGYGLVNAQLAVLAALEAGGTSPADNPRLVSSTSTLNFASGTSALELALLNGGKGELQLLEIVPSAPWLAVQAINVDPSGLGRYRVSVDRAQLDPGAYGAAILARSTVNDLTIQVLLTVGSTDSVADVGTVYVLLIDDLTGQAVAQFFTESNQGRYIYQFNEVEAGPYAIVAGSDADNDLLICDAGEACGALLTVDQPVVIDVQADREDLDFPIEYLVSLPDISGNGGSAPAATAGRARPQGTGARTLAPP